MGAQAILAQGTLAQVGFRGSNIPARGSFVLLNKVLFPGQMSQNMAHRLMLIFLLIGVAQAADHVGSDPTTEIEAMFESLGSGKCQDDDGSEGDGDDEPMLEPGKDCCPMPKEICMRRCGALAKCLAFSDFGRDCKYYYIEITGASGESDGETPEGACYNKIVKGSNYNQASKEETSAGMQAALGAFTLLAALITGCL